MFPKMTMHGFLKIVRTGYGHVFGYPLGDYHIRIRNHTRLCAFLQALSLKSIDKLIEKSKTRL